MMYINDSIRGGRGLDSLSFFLSLVPVTAAHAAPQSRDMSGA